VTGFEYGAATTIAILLVTLFLYDQTRLNKQEKLINKLQVSNDDKDIKEFVDAESESDRLKYLNSRDPSEKP
jgi:hypothetical protein